MYVVIGANGYLGSYIIKNILEGTSDDVIATATHHPQNEKNSRIKWLGADVTDMESLLRLNEAMSKAGSCKVVYLAAYHHPDKVEQNPKYAWNVNIIGLATFLNTINNVQSFYYASTDSVYGESINGYHFTEGDKLSPTNLYGKHKVLAEQLVITYGYNVVRYPFLIGSSLLTHKEHFFDVILNTLKSGNTIEMFADSYRNSLDFNTAAEILIKLMESKSSSIPQVLNASGDNDLSKNDVAVMIADQYGMNRNLIIPISTENDKSIFVAKRPKSTLLDNSLIKKTLGISHIKIKL